MRIAPSLTAGVSRLLALGLLLCAGAMRAEAQTATFQPTTFAAATGFTAASWIAVDGSGNLYVSDSAANTVVKIAAMTGEQTTIATGLSAPTGVALDAQGDVFVADTLNSRVVVVLAESGAQYQLSVTGLSSPAGLAFDHEGNLYISDESAAKVVRVTPDGKQSNVGSGYTSPLGLFIDNADNLFVADFGAAKIFEVSSSGTQTTVLSDFLAGPIGVAFDGDGNLFIADSTAGRVLEHAPNSQVYNPVVSNIASIYGFAIDPRGRLFLTTSSSPRDLIELLTGPVNLGSAEVCPAADQGSSGCANGGQVDFNVSSLAGVSVLGVTTLGAGNSDFTLNGTGSCGTGTTAGTCTVNVNFAPTRPGLRLGAVKMGDSKGNVLSTVYLSAKGVGPQSAITTGGLKTIATGLNQPTGVAIDGSGNVLITDTGNNRLLKVPAAGGTPVAVGGKLTSPTGVTVDGAGNIYVSTRAGTGLTVIPPKGSNTVFGSGLDGAVGLAMDPDGHVLVANAGGNSVLRKALDGSSTVGLGNGLTNPNGVAVSADGDVDIGDTNNYRVLVIPAGGTEEFVFGGVVYGPAGMALDAAGDLFVSDQGSNIVVEVPVGGTQFTVLSGLNVPAGLALDKDGNLYIVDSGNNRVVELVRSTRAAIPAIHFATTVVGATSSDSAKTAWVQNIGNAELSVSQVDYAKDFPIDFSAADNERLCAGESTLGPGELCSLAINFTPLKMGALSEMLRVVTVDNTVSEVSATVQIPLTGAGQGTQTITFQPPAKLNFGVAPMDLKGYAQASSGLAVSFKVVSGPATLKGTVLTLTGAGQVKLQASQAGNVNYSAATPVVRLIAVAKTTPKITWAPPASIVYGTRLSTKQLNATSTVPGKFVYSPAAGTALAAGAFPITVTFTPANTAGYSTATATVAITVTKATLTVTAKAVSITKGSAIPKFTPVYTGFVNGDTAAKALTGAPSLTTTATKSSPAGSYPIVAKAGTLASKNYLFQFSNGVLKIN